MYLGAVGGLSIEGGTSQCRLVKISANPGAQSACLTGRHLYRRNTGQQCLYSGHYQRHVCAGSMRVTGVHTGGVHGAPGPLYGRRVEPRFAPGRQLPQHGAVTRPKVSGAAVEGECQKKKCTGGDSRVTSK